MKILMIGFCLAVGFATADSSGSLRNDNKRDLRKDNKGALRNDNKGALRNDNKGALRNDNKGAAGRKEAMMHHAVGTFEVKMKPEPLSEVAAKSAIMRMSIEKTIHGQLEATTTGEFLASGTPDGSGGYVAMEKVTGTLDGKAGSFVLQHTATMNRKVPTLSITVVPDSGTGELVGLSGTFTVIVAADGKHSYAFDYSL